MDLDTIAGWLGRESFNDFELAPGRLDEVARLLDAPMQAGELHPLGFHGSGSWIALWRKDASRPWDEAAWVWIDAQGSPWEAFASSAAEGLAMLALDIGTICDALASGERAARSRYAEDEVEGREEWAVRTREEIARSASRHEGQAAYREDLVRAGIALPINAFAVAIEAIRRSGRFSEWVRERREQAAPPPRRAPAKKTTTAAKTTKAGASKTAASKKPSTKQRPTTRGRAKKP